MHLIKYNISDDHVSQNTASEFESVIVADASPIIYNIDKSKKALGKVLVYLLMKTNIRFLRKLFTHHQQCNVCVLLGDEFHKAIIPFVKNSNNNCYFFDAWPSNHYYIEKFIRNFNVKNVFFSSRQVVELFNTKKLHCNVHWVPEGINIENYRFKEYQNKNIDVLAFGRKHEGLHNKIVDDLRERNINYLYEHEPGKIIFPRRQEFIEGLSRTKISICIPSNITHPERSGSISTMTIRYLQSMASKCLILGYMPDDMKLLFDYSPLIEINMDDPLSQIHDILDNFHSYIPLIEQNYKIVASEHSWINRWNSVKEVLQETC